MMNIRLLPLKLLLCVLCSGACQGQETTVFTNVRVFDGTQLKGPTNVVVVQGVIAEVGDLPSKEKDHANATIVDGNGRTLLPGFLDCHNHAFHDGHLRQAALFGVTTEFDMMSVPQLARGMRQQQAAGQANDRADFFSAGAAVTVDGGHGTQFGFPVPTLDKAENAAEFVKARANEGSDYIKIIYEDGSAYGFSRPTLSAEMVKAAIEAAHAEGLLAVAHVSTAAGARLVVDSGIDGLVHLFCDEEISDELAANMLNKEVFVVPTASVVSNASDANLTAMITDDPNISMLLEKEDFGNLTKSFPKRNGLPSSTALLNKNILKLHQAGVQILAGTDSLNPGTTHGASLHHELRLLVAAGLTPKAALTAATSAAAKCFKQSDRGSIAKGKRADLVLVDGDPTEDIRNAARIVNVWKGGILINRQAKIAQIQQRKDAAKRPAAKGATRTISNFESMDLSAEFGTGWSQSTDVIMGGTSTVTMKAVPGGAEDSKGAMKVAGKTRAQQPAFSGVMFSPGGAPMQPADLSKNSKLRFWAKGAGTDLQVMLFFQSRGFTPSMKTFSAGDKWAKHEFAIADFDGCDGSDVIGIWFGSGTPGDFEFLIDSVELE